MVRNQLGGFFKPGRPLPPEIREEIADLYNAGYSMNEAYVWIFDPLHPKTFVMGILLVVGVIAICLFPLWPEKMRDYSWYISVLAAVFVGVILFLAILRYIIFGVIWVLTIGKLHFWMLPNLTADCGFFESFVPAYDYEYFGEKGKTEDDENDKDKVNESETKKLEDDEKMAADEQTQNMGNVTKGEVNNEETIKDVKDTHSEKAKESSGSNRDTDENDGDTWVKVKKTDIEDEDQSSGQKSDVKC